MKKVSLFLLFVVLLAACSHQMIPNVELESLATFRQKQVLVGGNQAGAQFGYAVAIDGNRMVVGCRCYSKPDVAYVFERDSLGKWQYSATIKAGTLSKDVNTQAIALSGDTVVVGDSYQNANAGSIYIFERNQGGVGKWGLVKQVNSNLPEDFLGNSVSVSGDTVVAGASGGDISGRNNQGFVYIFQRNQGGVGKWGLVKKLIARDGAANDLFGFSVDIEKDTLVIGATNDELVENSGGGDVYLDLGSAYVFGRNQGGTNNWGQVTKLLANEGYYRGYFGTAVGINGDTIVVGADQARIPYNKPDRFYTVPQGAAYIFSRNQGGANTWGFVQKLFAEDGAEFDGFGQSLGVSGSTIVIGSSNRKVTPQGVVYVFHKGSTTWSFTQKLMASDGNELDGFARFNALAISNNTILVGAPGKTVSGLTEKGTAYIFE